MATTKESLLDKLRKQNQYVINGKPFQQQQAAPTGTSQDLYGGSKQPTSSILKPSESLNEYQAMQNDYTNLFQGDKEITDKINTVFTGMGDRLNQGGQLGNQVGQEYLDLLNKDYNQYQAIFGEGGQARQDLDAMLAQQQAALDAEQARMSTIYNLENEGIAANAAASGATGGQINAQRARLRGEEAQRRADYATKVAELAATKKQALLDMYDKISAYKQNYLQNFANSRDKYVLDNYNQITEAQTNLLAQIKNFELQERQMAANAASASQLASAIGGKATPTGNNIPTGPSAIDPIPAGYYDGLVKSDGTKTPQTGADSTPTMQQGQQFNPSAGNIGATGGTYDPSVGTGAVAGINNVGLSIPQNGLQIPNQKQYLETQINALRNEILSLSNQPYYSRDVNRINVLTQQLLGLENLYRTT